MNEEERKAIEYLKENPICRIEYDEFGNEKIVAYGSAFKYIILNLINKQEKAIDRMAEKIYKTWLNDSDAIVIHIDKVPENSSIEEIKEYFMEDKE